MTVKENWTSTCLSTPSQVPSMDMTVKNTLLDSEIHKRHIYAQHIPKIEIDKRKTKELGPNGPPYRHMQISTTKIKSCRSRSRSASILFLDMFVVCCFVIYRLDVVHEVRSCIGGAFFSVTTAFAATQTPTSCSICVRRFQDQVVVRVALDPIPPHPPDGEPSYSP
jgi:hypothetical protein